MQRRMFQSNSNRCELRLIVWLVFVSSAFDVFSAAASDMITDIAQLPPTERVSECLRLLETESLDNATRTALIALFAQDAQNLSPQYGCSALTIDEQQWIALLSEGAEDLPNDKAIIFALTQLLINAGQYSKAIDVINPYDQAHPCHESSAWLEYCQDILEPNNRGLVPITQDTLEFDVHICVITAKPSAHKIATLAQLHEEVEILNRRFVTLDGNPLVRFRFKSASFYKEVERLNCPFVSLGDSTSPYSSSGYAQTFNECNHPRVRDTHAINFYVYDSYNSDVGFNDTTCHGKRNSNRPYILIDWERLNNTNQSPEVHEMGHAFGLGHVAVPGADRWTHTNIMCSAGLDFGSGGRRNLGFTEAQSAIILYHARRTFDRLQ